MGVDQFHALRFGPLKILELNGFKGSQGTTKSLYFLVKFLLTKYDQNPLVNLSGYNEC